MHANAGTAETLDYRHSPLPVRDELVAAHRRAWTRLAAPGEWWTGAVRVAIAAETRAATDCALCKDRRAALSPRAVTGTHTAATDLPEVLIEVIHRVRTDSGRLTRQVYDEALAGGLGDAEYVETIGVMATVIAIDTFCDAMELPRHALPVPVPGEPRRRRPAGAKEGLAWVPTVAPEDLTEAEAGMYDGLAAVNIHRAPVARPCRSGGVLRPRRSPVPPGCVAAGLRDRASGAHARADRIPRGAGLRHQPVLLLNHQPRGAAPWERRAHR